VVPIGDGVLALPSFEVGAPGFDAERYWRGPVWPMLTWLAYHGALRYGRSDLADGLQAALVELPRTGGFREHYHPLTGAGQGGDAFSWTAALALDVLAEAAAAEPRR
jgi:glycogen debranching enzyme